MTRSHARRVKNILVVHNVENLGSARRSTLDHIYCFERYAPEHNYVYHRSMLPVTEELRTTSWDAVIFESTSLGIVTLRPRSRFQHLRESWRFLREIPAIKLAFPQDDATHSAYLDYFFRFIGLDAAFSVRPERKEKLYPLTSETAEFISTVAGFIDDASLDDVAALARPFAERRWEIGQRVTFYPAWGGRFARRKSSAALQMQQFCRDRGLPENVSTDPKNVFVGDDWYRFLGDCRFVVGAEGGHGIWDPYGAIQDEVNDYVARHPEASFEEIEDACFFGIDGRETFPGFAPRVLEAAMMGCGQVLLEGAYRGFIQPGKHYIELKDDYSNLDDVFAQMANRDHVQGMVAATRRDLVDNPFFRYSGLVERCFALIERKQQGRAFDASPVDIANVRARHRLQLATAIVAELRAEGMRGAALMERAALILRGQEPAPGFGGRGTDEAVDWARVIVPVSDDAPPAPTPGARRPLGKEAAYLNAVESNLTAELGQAIGEAGSEQAAAARLASVLATARRLAEGLEEQTADLGRFADALGLDRSSTRLLDAVLRVRPQLSDAEWVEKLALVVESDVEVSDALGRLLQAAQIEPKSEQRGRLEFVIGVLEATGSDVDVLKRQRIRQFARLISHSPVAWRMIHKLGRLAGK
jgi:hypothetical protein